MTNSNRNINRQKVISLSLVVIGTLGAHFGYKLAIHSLNWSGFLTSFYMLSYIAVPLGLGWYAHTKGRSIAWGLLGFISFLGPLVALLVIEISKAPVAIEKDASMDKPVVPEKLYKTVMIAFILYVIDAFLLNQGIIAMITIPLVVVAFVLLIFLALYKKDKAYFIREGTKTVIYGVMAVAILVTNVTNNKLARSRAEDIISAVEQYKVKHQKFPDRLEDLVPEFLPKIPRAKIGVMMFGRFRYDSGEDSHYLEYVSLPPFGRPYYKFEEKQWAYMD